MGESPKPLFVTLAQRKQPQSEAAPRPELSQQEGEPVPQGMLGMGPTPAPGLVGPNVTFFPPAAGDSSKSGAPQGSYISGMLTTTWNLPLMRQLGK